MSSSVKGQRVKANLVNFDTYGSLNFVIEVKATFVEPSSWKSATAHHSYRFQGGLVVQVDDKQSHYSPCESDTVHSIVSHARLFLSRIENAN